MEKQSLPERFFGCIGYNAILALEYSKKFSISSFLAIQKNLRLFQKPNMQQKLILPAQQTLQECNISISKQIETNQNMKQQEIELLQ